MTIQEKIDYGGTYNPVIWNWHITFLVFYQNGLMYQKRCLYFEWRIIKHYNDISIKGDNIDSEVQYITPQNFCDTLFYCDIFGGEIVIPLA